MDKLNLTLADRPLRSMFTRIMNETCSIARRMLNPLAMTRDLNVDQIKKLWVLDLIIQAGSMRKAALQAKVSPSAISQTLSSLERSVGRPLILRENGKITPTHDALAILEVVRPAFEAFNRLKDLNQTAVPKMAWLNFGTYESIAINILPGLIHRLRDKMPGLKLNVHICRTAQLLTMTRKGELCSALITETDDLDRFYVKTVAEETLGFFVSRKHPISSLGWSSVKKFGVGSLAPGKLGLPRYYSKFMRQLGPEKPTILSDSFETLRCAAASGAIVSVLPHRVANRQDDLLEIYPENRKPKEKMGQHKILIVSPGNCDPEEANFLATEASFLLNKA